MRVTRNYNVKKLVLSILKSAIILSLIIETYSCSNKEEQLYHWVNPFIGTGGHGHTYPGASAPFGMVQLSPDTRTDGWDACSGYHYSDSTILGFSHTHLSGTGAADYGDILITPGYTPETPKLSFQHKDEEAWAGYYGVNTQNGIEVRLTTTPRVGIHQINFQNPTEKYISINLEHGIGPDKLLDSKWHQSGKNRISGYRRSNGWAKDQHIYFVAQFSKPFEIISSIDSTNKVILRFEASHEQIQIKIGISAVSYDGAAGNIESEAIHWSFEKYLRQAEARWQNELGKIDASFNSDDEKTVFYTALYHSFLAPNLFSDTNNEYRGIDGSIHKANKQQFTVFSLWDTFRATHPLFTLINSDQNVEMIKSMLNLYQQGGLLPVWELAGNETGTMIGYHAIPVIADAIMKNTDGFDYNIALKAMVHSANQDHLGLNYYKESGYISLEKEHESVSKTLEYAYDDWCIAQVALKLGEDSLYDVFSRRAQNYKNLYDPETGFMRPKRNGNWLEEFDPNEVSGNYTEANAWQYSYFVPHDLTNLNKLLAPNASLESRLDDLFTANSNITGRHQPDIDGMIGQYAHGNEPSHNFAYLYAWTDSPWKSQKLVNQINSEMYSNSPDGLSGNEDCGQMSSWHIFSALGFYPAVPGSNEYIFGTPLIKTAQISLSNGELLKVKVNRFSDAQFYIKAIQLNGLELDRYYITHDEIMNGGELIFEMSDEPVTHSVNNFPTSTINTTAITRSPIIKGGEMTFTSSKKVSINSDEAEVRTYFTVDGSTPDSTSKFYDMPFELDSTVTVKSISYAQGKLPSGITNAQFVKIPFGRSIDLKDEYSHLYTGNSRMALIDHIYGGSNFRDGWQGFHEVNLDAVVDLGEVRSVTEVNVGFLQDHYSWIFYPEWLEISFSYDGKSFTAPIIVENFVEAQEDGLIMQRLSQTVEVRARYVKVLAKNIGKCPDWHKGAGRKAWLFADEIEINTN